MQKPKQTKITRHTDNTELMEALESALDYLGDAMEAVRGYDELTDYFKALGDMHDDLYAKYEECEIMAHVEYTEMMRELTRDYFRSVM